MTVPEVISAIMAMDATKLGESAFEGLLQFVPTEVGSCCDPPSSGQRIQACSR